MAKALTADQLENLLSNVLSKVMPEIMMKILEKFDTCFDRLLSRFDDRFDKHYADLHSTNARLDKLEQSLADIKKSCTHSNVSEQSVASQQSGSVKTEQKTDTALHVLMALETEKAERVKRQRNVIVTGLSEVTDVPDEEMFAKFCEENLTVKPKPTFCRRIGHSTEENPES